MDASKSAFRLGLFVLFVFTYSFVYFSTSFNDKLNLFTHLIAIFRDTQEYLTLPCANTLRISTTCVAIAPVS